MLLFLTGNLTLHGENMRINRNTIANDISSNPFMGKSQEELDEIINYLEPQVKNQSNRRLQTISDFFMQKAGMTSLKPEKNDINDFIQKELIKQKLDEQDPYKQSQVKLNEAILGSINNGQGGDLIYRDPATGQEISQEQALQGIQQGQQYIINRRITSRQGIKEESVSKPEDLTQEEKQYMITSKRVLSSIDALQNQIYPTLDKMGGDKNWQAFQAQNLPFATIGNQNIEDFKSAITQLKSDIPFLRGGKQLTATEAKRVDILLNPFGKSKETRIKDIERFKKEFLGGAELMKGGIRYLNRQTTPLTTQSQIGQTPEEENIPIKNADNFQIGQTMKKNGITYTYKGNGQWEY